MFRSFMAYRGQHIAAMNVVFFMAPYSRVQGILENTLGGRGHKSGTQMGPAKRLFQVLAVEGGKAECCCGVEESGAFLPGWLAGQMCPSVFQDIRSSSGQWHRLLDRLVGLSPSEDLIHVKDDRHECIVCSSDTKDVSCKIMFIVVSRCRYLTTYQFNGC